MIWGWLKAICRALFDALFDKLWKEAKKPDTIENVNTPEDIKSAWRTRVADFMRHKDDCN
jgi:hypothetical protein